MNYRSSQRFERRHEPSPRPCSSSTCRYTTATKGAQCGLTGLAQVSGRNSISWEEKFDLDVRYVDNVSFLSDCKIILATIKKVIARDGINQEGEATMEVFRGSSDGIAR